MPEVDEWFEYTKKRKPARRKPTGTQIRFQELKDKIQAFIDDGHTMIAAAGRFGFNYEALRSCFRRLREKEGLPPACVKPRVESERKRYEIPIPPPLPTLVPGESYRIVSGVYSGGFGVLDPGEMVFVREVKAPHAVGGRLFMFTSSVGCIESFTAYQLQTCFGATSTRESNRTKIPSLLKMGKDEAA